MKEVLGKCPICDNNTIITKIVCRLCETTIEGSFRLCKFCGLNSDQKLFLDVFIKCRGNIKEVEKELGISYPTVKNRLEDLASALGHKTEQSVVMEGNKNKSVLEKINSGEMSVEEALKHIKE